MDVLPNHKHHLSMKNILYIALGIVVAIPVFTYANTVLTQQTKLVTLPGHDGRVYRIYDVATNDVCYVVVATSTTSVGQGQSVTNPSISCLPYTGK